MKKVILTIMLLSVYANAGFWSSAIGTAVGGGGTKNYYIGNSGNDAKEEPKKIQQTLSKLGFYSGKFDGNLNSFDTRSAVEDFQSYYSLPDSGVLNESQKQDLLYMHDLLKNYKLEFQNPKKQDSKRLKKLYKAFDKLEKKISKGKFSGKFMSAKFKKEISKRRIKIAKTKKQKALRNSKVKKWKKKYLNFPVYADYETKLIWENNRGFGSWITKANFKAGKYTDTSGDTASTYCKKLSLAGSSNWRLPTKNELLDLRKKKTKFKDDYSTEGYWSSTTHNNKEAYYINLYLLSYSTGGYAFKNRIKNVKCVSDGR